jgi:hypothetical protein
MRNVSLSLLGLLLGLVLACGGGSNSGPAASAPSGPAHGLAYTDPSSTGWRLVKDPSSTATRIVLNLVGPAGTLSRGIGFNLQVPPSVHIGAFGPAQGPFGKGLPVQDGGVYELGNHFGTYDLEPGLLAGGVKAGNILTVGIFQKDRTFTAKPATAPLLRIALEFDPSADLKAGDALPLVVLKAKYLASDIGPATYEPTPAEYEEMVRKGRLTPITLAVGSLTAN